MTFDKPYLEKYKGGSTRYDCPQCSKKKSFARYINPDTNNYFDSHVGRCNRESNCGYHYPPKQYIIDNNLTTDHKPYSRTKRNEPTKTVHQYHIPLETLRSSLMAYDRNSFVLFLNSIFDSATVDGLIKTYFIGTSGKWNGANVFWYVNKKNNVRYGSIMLYDEDTGKRTKYFTQVASVLSKKDKAPDWVKDYEKQEGKIDCLFGEHLLSQHPNKPVAVCESEKTAIIASVYLPMFVWLASGAKGYLKPEKCKVLKGRNVTLYPDTKAFEDWKAIADREGFKIDRTLKEHATPEQYKEDIDIADLLVRSNPPSTGKIQHNPPESYTDTFTRFDGVRITNELNSSGYPAIWDSAISKNDTSNDSACVKNAQPLDKLKAKNPMMNDFISTFDMAEDNASCSYKPTKANALGFEIEPSQLKRIELEYKNGLI